MQQRTYEKLTGATATTITTVPRKCVVGSAVKRKKMKKYRSYMHMYVLNSVLILHVHQVNIEFRRVHTLNFKRISNGVLYIIYIFI